MTETIALVLPEGYADASGRRHRDVVMRLATARDEMCALSDFRVHLRPDWFLPVILSRIVLRLGDLEGVSVRILERLGEADRAALERAYREAHGYGVAGQR